MNRQMHESRKHDDWRLELVLNSLTNKSTQAATRNMDLVKRDVVILHGQGHLTKEILR